MAVVVEPIPLRARLFYSLRELARFFYLLPQRLLRRRLLGRRVRVGAEGVNYGRLAEPPPGHLPIGGEIKLFHLRRRFPEAFEAFDVVYLVSSALPRHADELVRYARRRGGKLVWNQNGVAYPAWCGAFYPWFNLDMGNLWRQADYVIHQSAFCRLCAERYLGPTSAPGEVLFNPVDLERFRPVRTERNRGVRLLAMGTSHHFYRVKASLDCLASLRRSGEPARLRIAGGFRWADGEAEVRSYIARRGLGEWVELLPPFTQEEAPELYRSGDVLLHPKYKDPCPTVIIEALASGLPIVASRSGGLPEMVPDACGELLDVPDDWTQDHAPSGEAMAEGVLRILADRPRYAAAARSRAEEAFDAQRWVDSHERIFEKVRSA